MKDQGPSLDINAWSHVDAPPSDISRRKARECKVATHRREGHSWLPWMRSPSSRLRLVLIGLAVSFGARCFGGEFRSDELECDQAAAPQCGGTCPTNMLCRPNAAGTACNCVDIIVDCGQAVAGPPLATNRRN